MGNPKLSLGMVVRNEELLLGQCLKKARPFVDEVLIVDTGSTDRTKEMARRFGAQVIPYRWDGSFGRARNVHLRNATSPWILVLDGDERITTKDFRKIRKLIEDTNCIGYYLEWRDYQKNFNLLSDWHPNDGSYPNEEEFSQCPGWSRNRVLRLFQKKEGVCYEEGFSWHPNPLRSLLRHSGKIKQSDIVIHHFQYRKGGDAFIFKKQKDRLRSEVKHLKLHPKDAHACRNIAKTLFSLKKDREALGYLKKALQVDPSHPETHFLLGMVHKEMGGYREAVKNLTQALRLRPGFVDARALLGIVYELQGKLIEAKRVLKRALRLHPTHLLARNTLGIVYQTEGKISSAEKEFKKALEIYPEFPDATFNLAQLYEAQNDVAKAEQLYQRLLKIRPDDGQARRNLHAIRAQRIKEA